MECSQSFQRDEGGSDGSRGTTRSPIRIVLNTADHNYREADSGSPEPLDGGPADLTSLGQILGGLLLNLQSQSGNDYEDTCSEDAGSEGVESEGTNNGDTNNEQTNHNSNPVIDLLFNLSRGTSQFISSHPYTFMARGLRSYNEFMRSGVVGELHQAIECWETAISVASDSNVRKPEMLINLGGGYLARFDYLGKVHDLERSVECETEALSLTPNGHEARPSALSHLAHSCLAWFLRFGELAYLNKAIEYGEEAVLLSPDGHEFNSKYLTNLANSYYARFERFGELADLENAIKRGEEAVPITLDDHTEKPTYLSSLGTSYNTRFRHLGELADLNKAIECKKGAVLLAPNGHIAKPGILNSLGTSCCSRYKRTGELTDLQRAIDCMTEAVLLTPNDHVDKSMYLSNLGNLHHTRFENSGDPNDLNKAIECGVAAVSLAPHDQADNPARLNNLGSSYRTLFKLSGRLDDLDKAIELGVEAVLLTPGGHIDKPSRLSNLGGSYLARFGRSGELVDLNKAIECGAEAASLTPNSYEDKPGYLSNLGNSYSSRFERFGELIDLDRAIECGADAVSLISNTYAERSTLLNNLGYSYFIRFRRSGQLGDLNRAIKCGVEAVSLAPDGQVGKPGYFSNLGNAYCARFERFRELADLNDAIGCGEVAISLIPDGHADKPACFNNLGNSYRNRYKRFEDQSDLNKAIECVSEAVSLSPDGHADKPGKFLNLGGLYIDQYLHSHKISDLELAITAYRTGAQAVTGPPEHRFSACREWARWASHHPDHSSYPAYQRAIELLPQLIWIGSTLHQRYSLVASIGDFATEAAAYAINADNLELALQWLEAGRSIVWGQIAQLRTPFELLFAEDPDLASRLKDIGHRLEHVGSRSPGTLGSESHDAYLWHEAASHVQLALDWDQLLKEVRSIPGFENFLQPPRLPQLLSAASSHSIVVINAHKSRCDALILQPHSDTISHVPLLGFSVELALAARERLAPLVGHRGFAKVNKSSPRSLESALKDLWSGVVEPILDFLGFTHTPATDQLPRLTWCTTGVLSFLPLHAAGCYDQSQANAFDLAISSYTPTISALLTSQATPPATYSGMLAVGQEHTPGFNSLPCTRHELGVVQKYSQANRYLQLENDEATTNRVLDAMAQFSWLHMACHGSQNPTDPTQSAFHLHDGSLTLTDITKRSFTNKGIAFLSACETAMGDKDMPDEAVHLAAGLLMAGYPSVIGTMWSIADEDGPEVAEKVYAELLSHDTIDHTKAARALHRAVAHLRAKVGEKAIVRWAPFIHIGS